VSEKVPVGSVWVWREDPERIYRAGVSPKTGEFVWTHVRKCNSFNFPRDKWPTVQEVVEAGAREALDIEVADAVLSQ
jgi:hypothetical protein